MSKIFLTGATGYIGGTALTHLASLSPPPTITALVRSPTSIPPLQSLYPNLRLLLGSLDDTPLLEAEARAADIVLNLASTSHIASARAIARGLTDPEREKKGHWVQISGGTLLAQEEIKKGRFGYEGGREWDDVRDVEGVKEVVRKNPGREVDNLVVGVGERGEVKTALVVGPHIYGVGGGKGGANTRSVQAPEMARVTLELGEGFRLGEGKNSWSNVHVEDLGELIGLLVGAAVEGKEEDGIWGKDGIYFPENGALTFGELSEKIAKEAHTQGLIPKASVDRVIDAKETDTLSSHSSVLWGTNAVIKSSRAQSLLGWAPSRPSLEDEIPGIVAREAENRPKH